MASRLSAGFPGGVALDKTRLADEIADIIISCDLLACSNGINLGEAVRTKFNKTSVKIDSPIRL